MLSDGRLIGPRASFVSAAAARIVSGIGSLAAGRSTHISAAALPPSAITDDARAPGIVILGAFGLAGLALATLTAAYGLAENVDSLKVALYEWMIIPYTGAGLLVWRRRPDSRLGPLLIAGGLGTGLAGLQFAGAELPYTIGAAVDLLAIPILLHAYLAFPDGRLRSRFERILVVVAYPTAVGIQLFRLTIGSSRNVLEVGSLPDLDDRVRRWQLLLLGALLVGGFVALAMRRRQAGRPRRHGIALVIELYGLALLLAAALLADAAYYGPHLVAIQRATWVVVGLAPIVFLMGLLDARLARSDVGDLLIELRSDLAPAELQDALARTLRDPSLTLAYWLPDFGSYVDLGGRPVEVPSSDGRSATPIIRNGEHMAALLHDQALDDEPEFLASVGAAAGIAVENARLQAELTARLEEVRGSRARVFEAGQQERKRLERNLHDGAQQRLVALSLELSLLDGELGEQSDARVRLDRARGEIAASLTELREIARGIHPAVVSGHGLEVALEQLTTLAPVPVRLTVAIEERLPEALEVAAYYIVCESLANIGKYARASSATVAVTRADDNVLIEVTDDGVGGADTERGSGLRGLADRVEALDGRLRIWSPSGGGTRIRAEIPCAP